MNLTVLGLDLSIDFFRPDLVRVQKTPAGKTNDRGSVSVVATPESVAVKTTDDGALATLASDALIVEVDKTTGRIRFLAPDGACLLAEKPDGASFPIGDFGSFGEIRYTGARQSFRLDPGEALYGLGQHQTGRVNQRSQHLLLSQINMESAVMVVQSTKGYGLFWDNPSPTDFRDDPSEMSFASQVGEAVDYYFLGGGSADAVLANVQWLTGKPPIPPLWTLGYCQSKERYASQMELEDIVRRYRELGVPLDVVIQDWRYWGDRSEDWNGMVFRKDGCFPDMKAAVDRIHAMHAKVFISIWPNFGFETAAVEEFKKAGAIIRLDNVFNPKAEHYDPWNPAGRDLYWALLQKELVPSGVDAWWMDATEPEHTFRPVQCMWAQNDPLDAPTCVGPFRARRNEYPLMHVEGLTTRQRRDIPDRRPVVLTRSAYAGEQRTGAFVWSGDVNSTWEALRRQITAGVNFSMSGLPLWNSDIGGFFGDREYVATLFDPGFHELYVRWLQFGAFCPMMRSHGTATPREIWRFGERGTWAFDAIEAGIRLRYALLPYFYANARRIATKGGAYLYPVAMEEPANTALHEVADEFTLGHNLLVAPVLESLYVKDQKADFSVVKTRRVILPTGAWYDFYTEAPVSGTFDAPAPIGRAPLYVRAGTILPIGPDVQYSTEKAWDDLEIRVYPGADGSFTLYEDAFDGFGYEKGECTEIDFAWDDAAKKLTISARRGAYPGMLETRRFRVRIAGTDTVSIVEYVGKDVTL